MVNMAPNKLFINLFSDEDIVEFPAGQTVIRAGETGETMYVVIEGEVEIVNASLVLEVAGRGSIVGELALIDDEPRSATVTAKTRCRLVPVDRRRFQYMTQETPFFALAVMKVLADRLRCKNVRTRTQVESGA
jgi:CRP/FNR family transcriptional regulator, cyclic AMP receptor protein